MKILVKFLVIFSPYFAVNGKSNISSYLRLGHDISNSRDNCAENIDKCIPLNKILVNSTCYSIKLPYKYTVQNSLPELEFWSPVRAIPKCWTFLQTLLCSLKYPECSQKNSEWFVNNPPREICKAAKRECLLLLVNNNENSNYSHAKQNKFTRINSIVERTPNFLNCNNYPSNCHVNIRRSHQTDLPSCQWPMVNTVQSTLWVKGFEGCSFHCKTPFFSNEEYQLTKSIFGSVGLIFFLFNMLVLVTLIIHQFQHRNYKWHPMLLNLFIIHFYLLISSIGWMIQLIPGIGHSVICRNDGALQIREPQVRVGESIWCVVVFSMIYFSLFASTLTALSFFYSILSVVTQYSSCWTQNHNTSIHENRNQSTANSKVPFLTKKIRFSLRKADNKNKFNFQNSQIPDLKQDKDVMKFSGIGANCDSINARNHSLSSQLFVVLISASLLIISLTIGEIKADPLSGICFVANDSIIVRISLSLLPLTIILVVLSIILNIIIFHIRIIQRHLNLYASSQQKIHSERMSKTATFYVFVLIFLWMFWCFSVYTHTYILGNEKLWYEALTNQFLCKLRQSLLPTISILDSQSEMMLCPLETRPSVNVFILHNFGFFSINIIFLLCTLFNKYSLIVWKIQFQRWFFIEKPNNSSTVIENTKLQSYSNSSAEKFYFGLQNRSLLDSIWNPGIFVYLVYKDDKKVAHKDNLQINLEDKITTFGSTENSSASFCFYQHDGSLRSCVSMPPINVFGPQTICQCTQNSSIKSEICPTLENFLKGTQTFIGQNSVRRSNSYAGRPYLVANSPIRNVSIPNSCYHSGMVNQQNSFYKDSFRTNSFVGQSGLNHLTCSNSNCFQNSNFSCAEKSHCQTLNGCISMSHLTSRRNTLDNSSSKYNKSLRRFSMSSDRKYEKGVSSRSTLNHRKRASRYSVSPKSVSKTLNNQPATFSRLGDPSSQNSSSFSAESYNSYNLMSQQIGGKWRDICRTRMTLHDVMIWAKAASQNHMPMHGICHNPLCNYCPSSNICGHANCGTGSNVIAENKQCPGTIPHSLIYQKLNQSAFQVEDQSHNEYQLKDTKGQNMKMNIQSSINNRVSADSNNSSDKFNSDDEIVSAENSVRDGSGKSEEFCSEDEVISLINSENQA